MNRGTRIISDPRLGASPTGRYSREGIIRRLRNGNEAFLFFKNVEYPINLLQVWNMPRAVIPNSARDSLEGGEEAHEIQGKCGMLMRGLELVSGAISEVMGRIGWFLIL